jgi:hypothetical protein
MPAQFSILNVQFYFDNGTQKIVATPDKKPQVVDFPGNFSSPLIDHIFSAIFTAMTDRLTGTMALFSNSSAVGSSPYSIIDTNLENTILLGSNDTDYFFNENRLLIGGAYNDTPSAARALDKQAAGGGRPLDQLIPELMTNISISLMTDSNLSPNRFIQTTQVFRTNLYTFNTSVFWIFNGLSIGITLIVCILGLLGFSANQASHDMSFSTIVSICRGGVSEYLFPRGHGRLPHPSQSMTTPLELKQVEEGLTISPLNEAR